MNRPLHHAAFATGALAIAWVAAGYLPGNLLALALLLPIGAVYGMGAWELRRFQQGTTALARLLSATTEPPPALGPWLAPLPASLRHAVRLRVEGERVALPGPALTPYLTGLLVLLGMLGTFLGMVVTLKGTGLALEHATDVDAIRASLAAPVKGLGLAFGTSVAGVAASAMLGLMSALARRERQQVGQALDALAAGTLRDFSRAHQREQVLQLQRAQADLVPALVTQMQALATQLAQQNQALQDQLLAGQARFQADAQHAYTGLAESVDRSLKSSLSESARLASAAIEPAVTATLAGLARESATLRETLATAVQQQLDGITARLDHSSATLAARWQAALDHQQRQGDAVTQRLQTGLDQFAQTFEQRSAAWLDGVGTRLDQGAQRWAEGWMQAQGRQQQDQAALLQHTRDALTATLAGFEQQAAALQRGVAESQAAAQRVAVDAQAAQQQQICRTLEDTAQRLVTQADAQARATLAEIAQLMQAASAAPRAAAEVMGELRRALSDSLVRDNAALDERNQLLGTLGGLLDAVNHASTEQRAAIDALVHTTTEVLGRAGAQFAQTVDAGSHTLQHVAAQVSGSAAEVASLGEGFGVAVQLFSRASEQLMAQLQRIEGALGQSMARSDEQLAYYVAQAREIVDLTLGSQKQVIDDLQQLTRATAPARAA